MRPSRLRRNASTNAMVRDGRAGNDWPTGPDSIPSAPPTSGPPARRSVSPLLQALSSILRGSAGNRSSDTSFRYSAQTNAINQLLGLQERSILSRTSGSDAVQHTSREFQRVPSGLDENEFRFIDNFLLNLITSSDDDHLANFLDTLPADYFVRLRERAGQRYPRLEQAEQALDRFVTEREEEDRHRGRSAESSRQPAMFYI